jgi:hypothetical protein
LAAELLLFRLVAGLDSADAGRFGSPGLVELAGLFCGAEVIGCACGGFFLGFLLFPD